MTSLCVQRLRFVPSCRHPESRQTSAHTDSILTELSLSPPIPLRLYTLPYWCNPPFLIFDIRALWRSRLSTRAPECQKLRTVGYTSMALNPSNGSNLEHLALKGLYGKLFQFSFVNLFTVRHILIYLYLVFTAAVMGCV